MHERALKLSRRLQAVDKRLCLGIGIYDNGERYFFCKLAGTGKAEFELENKTNEEIIEKCKELLLREFKSIKNLCINVIGETVYLDKKHPIKIKSIISKDSILSVDNNEYPVDRLYLKE